MAEIVAVDVIVDAPVDVAVHLNGTPPVDVIVRGRVALAPLSFFCERLRQRTTAPAALVAAK